MFEENARQILDLFGKEAQQGIITADETARAITILENEIAHRKTEEAREKEEREKKEREEEERQYREKNDDEDSFGEKSAGKKLPPVPFSARAYPFLQMLYAAHRKKRDIVWGV